MSKSNLLEKSVSEKDAGTLADFIDGELDGIDVSQMIQDYQVSIFRKDEEIVEIISSILERNISEEAFFIIDLGKIIRQYLRWKKCLPNVEAYYAMKCNPNPVILKILASLGCNFDCASKNEISSVIAITDDPGRIVFAHPCKMTSQIKYARANDVDLMTFDSDNELYKIKLYHPYSNLLMRIKVDDTGSKCAFSTKFGVNLSEARSLLAIAKSLKLSVCGVSFHVGSNAGKLDAYSFAVRDARLHFDQAKEMFDMDFTILDIGGGFPGVDDENGITFEDVAVKVNEAIEEQFGSYSNVRIIAEPGRFLVASSHTLVCNIIGKKEQIFEDGQQGFVYVMNDGLYGSFNCQIFDHATPEICPYNERDNDKKYNSKIFGPTCDSLDMISGCVQLPELAIGEWCYVENFGAYTQAAASSFNGFCLSEPIYVLTC